MSATNLLLSLASILYQIYDLLLSYSIFQPLLSIWATELLITQPIVDIWQNFGYGSRVKRKEKYLYIRKYNNITNNSKKQTLNIQKFHGI